MSTDATIKIFNSFYDIDLEINASEYEIVYSFFQKYISSETLAKTFAENLFRISNITGNNVLNLLQTLEGQDTVKIVLTMAFYLNTLSNAKTVLYGLTSVISPNEKVQRNIIL